MNTDEELYARFLCGEDDAIRQLMDRYLERLTLFCFTFLHSLTEAEDMALDAFAVIAMKRSVWYGGSFQRCCTASPAICPFPAIASCG